VHTPNRLFTNIAIYNNIYQTSFGRWS